ncbi:MAG: hypothetical protein HOJ64_01625, partial [Euryarchaeota archaeon]|nr:hypothetical protein [Euryarchaeota archaeon]
MIVLLLFLFSFQQPVDSLDIDYRTLIDMNIHYSTNTYRVAFNPDEKDLYIYHLGTGVLHKKNNTGTTAIDTLDRYLIDNTEILYDTRSKKLKFIDAGLGRVFDYDTNIKKLERTDKSYRLRSFYGFKGFINPNGSIFTYGGSGEFLPKNLILIFKQHGQSEWWQEETVNQSSYPSVFESHIDFLQLKDYYLLTYYEDKLVIRRAVNKGEYKEWKINNQYRFRLSELEGPSRMYKFSNYKLFKSTFNFIGTYFYDLEGNKLQKWVTDKKVYGVFNPPSNNDSLHVVYTLSDDAKNPFEFEIQSYAIVDFFENNTFEVIESERSRLSRFLLILLGSIILIVLVITIVRNRRFKNTNPFTVSELSVLVKTKNGKVSFSEKIEIDLFKIINRLFNSGTDKIELDQLDELMFKGLGYKTHITTRRNQLFDKINNELGHSFIRKQK